MDGNEEDGTWQQAKKTSTPLELLIVLLFVIPSVLPSALLVVLPNVSLNRSPVAANAVVALYSDRGADSSDAYERMFRQVNCTVVRVNADFINSGRLENFTILCMPGGDMYQYAQSITLEGMEKIRDFVRNGGGYFGICGGAYFTGERVVWQGAQLNMPSLGFFQGTAQGPINEIARPPSSAICRVNIVNSTHRITQGGPSSIEILYSAGPMFIPREDAKITVLGRYDVGEQPAVVAIEYGRGRVFIIGPHPEQGTDWNLIGKAVLWLSEE